MVTAQPGDERSDVIGDHLLAPDNFASAHFERLADDPSANQCRRNTPSFVYVGIGVAQDGRSITAVCRARIMKQVCG
jgi:hypothetical protein